ncbi:HlyD family secretion protein [Limnoglobus roseus]|uniref:Secretion protein HlyD family protein n=1 Tax=Limnoglobus roseus TaxID=2598579 RepID=A0A5C1AQW1_9BACT|nr:HlyD family efflux transporter periplasmic adaptor subunit [Limnoglobus roseus]QEL20112.1 secretion protein HlyD family protein [Limnoglobus roseus]
MRRIKILPYALCGCLAVGTLVGANRLSNNSGTPPGAGGNAQSTAPKDDGLVARGKVVTEHDLMPIHLPAHLPAGTVQQVHVKNAQAVKKGDPLVKFDDWQLQPDLKNAQNELQYALQKHQEALKGVEQHKILQEKADLAIQNAEQSVVRAKEFQEAMRKKLSLEFNRLPDTPNVEKRIREEPEYLKAEGLVQSAENQVKEKKLDKQQLAAAPVTELVNQAATKANEAQEVVTKAQKAVANCELKAEMAGTIERLSASPGQVVYPQSPPLFYLIPAGNRFVNAEIAPDFAYKIRDKDGSKVIISDDSNPGLTYEGTVEQIGTAFLPKSGGIDLLNGKPTYVLEVRIRVTDPAPAGKPPLLVNQPVRVTFP